MRTRLLFGMLALLSALSISSPATAYTGPIVFNGACSDCTWDANANDWGAGTASATLSLSDYVWGAELNDTQHFNAFTYTSERLGVLSPAYVYNLYGSFSSAASAAADVFLSFDIWDGTAEQNGFYQFYSHVAGDWAIAKGGFPDDIGNTHTWGVTPVPEPEIYAMLGVGLGLMGWVGRRRRLQAAA